MLLFRLDETITTLRYRREQNNKKNNKITKKDKMNILRLDFDTLELSPPFTCGGSSSSPTCTTTDGPLIGWGAKTLHHSQGTMGAMSLRILKLFLIFSLFSLIVHFLTITRRLSLRHFDNNISWQLSASCYLWLQYWPAHVIFLFCQSS